MPTPKFDQIAISFLHKAKGEFVSTFQPGNPMPDADFLTKKQISDYVNRALNVYFNNAIARAGFAPENVVHILPELIKGYHSTIPADGVIELPDKSTWKIFGFTTHYQTTDANGIVLDKDVQPAIEGGNAMYEYSVEHPIGVRDGRVLKVYPGQSGDIDIFYIASPIRTDGSFFEQNGDEDVPFLEHRFEDIAEIAYGLYLKDANAVS